MTLSSRRKLRELRGSVREKTITITSTVRLRSLITSTTLERGASPPWDRRHLRASYPSRSS